MSNWFPRHRMEWITEMLRVYGFINRKYLVLKFAISKIQAAKDLHDYRSQHPGQMEYDLTRKCYVARIDD